MVCRRIASRVGVGVGALALASAPLIAYASTEGHSPARSAALCSGRGNTGCSKTFQTRDTRSAQMTARAGERMMEMAPRYDIA